MHEDGGKCMRSFEWEVDVMDKKLHPDAISVSNAPGCGPTEFMPAVQRAHKQSPWSMWLGDGGGLQGVFLLPCC